MKVGMLSSEPVQPAAALDTVTLEIIRGKLIAVADEMGLVLARSSMSPVIYEVLDFACGICDADGLLIAQTNGITVFTGIFQTQIQAVLRKFAGRIHEGDVFLLNNPFEGGTHLCDVCIIRPIFVDRALAAFAIAVAHWSEVGGKTAGSLPSDATDIFQEGIRFPALKLFDRGVRQETIVEIITANGRLPKMSLGDLNAQLASVKIAEIRLTEVARKYGVATLHKTFAHILAAGGKEGSCNRVEVTRSGEIIRGARLPTLGLSTGDRVTLVTGGGGGFGDPCDRPIEEVGSDVRDGYITADQAQRQYAVVVSSTGEVDHAATSSLRAAENA
jgi:N-methylhydantoinase B/oxoprolinase/acetone carboxylase alpha subunit